MRVYLGKERRKRRTWAKIKKTGRMRKIAVFRSNCYILVRLVDMSVGKTITCVSSKAMSQDKKITKTEASYLAGKKLAEKAIKMGIRKVAFDRCGYSYHGRVKAVAEGARAGGLQF